MTSFPWGANIPQVNSTVIETGSTDATWMSASEAWMMLGEVAMTTLGIVGAQMFASIASISGIRSMTHEMLTPPFLLWLASMAGIAFKQALICEIVAMSYGQTRASMIPTFESTENRISEATAEATNVFGQNSPLIAQLNAQYAEYTAQNASLGMTYGDVITTATLPTPIPPPPPLGNLLGTAGQAAGSLGQAAGDVAQAAQGASQEAAQGASQEAAQAASQVASEGSSAAGGMDQMASLVQAPAQLAGQIPQTLSQAGNVLNPSQFSSVLSQFTSLFNGGSTGNAFAPALAAHNTGGLPLNTHAGATGGAATGSSGGMGMGNSGSLASARNGGGGSARSAVLTGITSPNETGGSAAPAGRGGAGGGMPMGHGPGNQGGKARAKRESVVLAAASSDSGGVGSQEAKGPERELFS